jgi:transposase-like protein
MLSIEDFLPSEERCAEVLRGLRWADGVECVWCGSREVVKNGSYMQFYQKYMCRGCGRSFNDKTGTVFEYSKMRVGEWLYIARELQKNKSINRISKELDRRYKHVMGIAHIVMERVKTKSFLEHLSGVVEMDEMYIPTGQKGTRRLSRRPRRRGLKLRGRGTWEKDKPPIMGLLERGGRAVLTVAKNVTMKAVDGLMELVGAGSVIITDDFRSYMHLGGEG